VQDPLVPGTQPKWCLVACSSWLRGQEFPVDARTPDLPIKVGRASHCDMIFAGTHLSREHAQLTILGDGILVRDLNSANGTFINDLRITEGIAYPGDQLRFDVYSFRLYGPAARPRATASNDDEATQIRRPPPVIEKPAEPPFEELPKRWKTRSTSPGNRVDEDSPKDEYPLAVKVIAVSLVLAVVALVTYLIIG